MLEALVGDIELEKYMGQWLQIAAKPAFFQNGCISSKALYELEYKGDTPLIKVTNSCLKDDGSTKIAKGDAKVKSDRALAVKFSIFMNIFNKPNYEIFYIDKAYQVAIVGSPDKKYLWILSRKILPKEQVLELLNLAKNYGFDISDVIFDNHK